MKYRHSRREIPPWTPCGYCFQEWASTWDHIRPVADGGSHAKENLFPSCQRCNSILQNHQFGSMEERRAYVQKRLKAKRALRKIDYSEELKPLNASGVAKDKRKNP